MLVPRIALLMLAALAVGAAERRAAPPAPPPRFCVDVILKEPVRLPNTLCELNLDFGAYLEKLGVWGPFDRHSVRVEALDPASGRFEPADSRLDERFKSGDSGRLLWLIRDPSLTVFRVAFDVEAHPARRPPCPGFLSAALCARRRAADRPQAPSRPL